MEPEIIKDGDTIIISTTQNEVYDLSVMRNELELLENESEPSTKEIVDAVKNNLPVFYYSPERQQKISWLREKIKELEAL